ncbi:MAG TPA: hypothetical protein VIJ15_07055, partial [Dermatophilaceae bacterium]
TVTEPSGTACVPGVISRKPLVFMFGRGGVSNGLYWSTFDPADTGGYAQSLWDLVPGAPPVAAVVGAWRYDRSPTDRRVFLFIRTTEYKLQFFTFDLESRAWAGPTDLGLPAGEPQSLDIVADQRSWRTTHPANLAVRSGRDIFVRPMNSAGTGWQDGDWKAFQISANSLNLDGIDIDKLFALEDYLWLGIRGQIEERFNGNSRSPDFNPRPWKDGEYIGGVEWNDSYFHVVQKRKSGVVEERVDPFYHGDPISDHFPMDGLRMIAPNIGGGADFAAFAYERRFEGWNPLSTDTEAEEDGVYLRLSFRYFAGDAPRFERYRIAPRVMPDVAGQFSIPARLDGPAVEQRRSTVKLTMSATSDSATNRIYAEEAYFFVPMLLCDGLRRAGEYAAAVDWAKTVYDYSRPPGEQKIYYGLIEEESLSALYTRTTDWLRDPLDPHAIAVTRGRTYTRFTLLSIVRLLLDFADDEFTRDTTETVPRARALYLAALTVLNSPELIQNTENCDEIIDAVDIPFDPGMPVKATVGVQGILSDLAGVTDYATLKALAPRVREVLASGSGWDERLVRARGLVDEVVRAEPPPTTVAGALELRAAATAHAFASVLTSPIVDRAALKVAQDAASQFRSSLESIPGLTEGLVETGSAALRWPRRSAVSTGARGVDFVFTPDLRPIAPPGSPSVAGLLAAASNGGSGRDAGQLPGPGGIRPPQGPPIIAAVVPSLAFCIPPNPLRGTLRMHAELNLLKLRTCRNIAGTKRELDPYAAPTDAVTGLPTIGASGQLVLAGTSVLRPTLYRFAALIQRAKELVALAQQIESAMLSAIEKHDAEAYSMLRARQDLELAQAGVQLQDLRLKQANDGVTLASLQATRAQIQLDHYQKLLDEGEIELERGAIEALEKAANLQVTASNLSFAAAALYGAAGIVGAVAGGVLGAGPGGVLGAALGALKDSAGVASGLAAASSGYSSLAAKTSTRAQIALTLASFERRKQDWELAASVAKQDVAIGAQQVTIAVDSVEISKQEKIIAEVTNTHAKDTVTFLANKFTNVDLYDWMGGVLESVYSFFLQQATSTARLAENQLAFERQEPPAGYIRSDYWQAPDDSLPTDTVQGAAPDRRGLTGSARLLQDLYRLDQYSFDTNKRKLQLSKTFSLALTAPTEF